MEKYGAKLIKFQPPGNFTGGSVQQANVHACSVCMFPGRALGDSLEKTFEKLKQQSVKTANSLLKGPVHLAKYLSRKLLHPQPGLWILSHTA